MVSSDPLATIVYNENVILLFPPLLVSPSRGFQGGNLWLSNFSSPFWGLFPLWHLAFLSLLCCSLVPRALFWHFLCLLALSGLLCSFWQFLGRVLVFLFQKPQEKPFLKTWGKISGWSFLTHGEFMVFLRTLFSSLWQSQGLSCTLFDSLALSGRLLVLFSTF